MAVAVIGVPTLHGGEREGAALVVFPVMVVGVGAIGLVMIAVTDGQPGQRDLRARWRKPVRPRWLLTLLIPPLAILGVLLMLSLAVSDDFRPNFFVFGFAAGFLAGAFEELAWTGFAYPRMRVGFGPFVGAVALGVLWGLWHVPVIDSLGAASPHRSALPAFIAAFIAVLSAVRVLISWIYNTTQSLLMAQLFHASSTGSLVVLSASRVTPAQEAGWYFVYAALLWIIVVTAFICDRSAFALTDETAAAL
jgi:membrane protease YdiL (CAAX protease family)